MRLPRILSKHGLSSLAGCGVSVLLVGLLAGCDTKGWIDPSEMFRGGPKSDPLVMPILNTVDPAIESANDEFVNASEPTAADLKSPSGEYKISRADLLSIAISDLQGPGQETVRTTRVNESGSISLPYIGAIKAEGLSEFELENAIVKAYRDANLIQRAQVSVTIAEARGRTFSILGAINRPGEYAIIESNFRVLNALVLAGDTSSPLVEYIYIIRQPEGAARSTSQPAGQGPAGAPATAPGPDELAPKTERPTAGPSYAAAGASVKPLFLADATPADVAHQKNEELLAEPAPGASASTGAGAATEPATAAAEPGFQFSEPSPDASRVIRIPLGALRAGDLKYNIAIHPKDVLIVRIPTVGNYYMGGHVQRPGAYSLNGQKITLKQAVISASMLDGLAIPQRTDLVRRIKPDHEVFVRVDLDKIFSGEQPDMYLKPDDEVMVGTNAVAPFIAAIRGAFRITYGAGFLYDRDFAVGKNGNPQ